MKALNTVTRNPAPAIGLADRGEIAPGKRADFIWVQESDGIPIVRGSWCNGERAFCVAGRSAAAVHSSCQ